MRQAWMTADEYFHHSLKILQGSGLKFTAADVVALAAVAAQDFDTSVRYKIHEERPVGEV
jgi:hypothetical protein